MVNFYKKNKWFRIICKILLILLIIFFMVLLFLRVWVPFGGAPSNNDKEDYEVRAYNYENGKFKNDGDYVLITDNGNKNNFISLKGKTPIDNIPIEKPNLKENLNEEDLNITWLGHSSILIQMQKMNILIDPVFSEMASPVSFVGVKRFSDLPITINELPHIDIVIITHDHYDHLDYQTIRNLDNKVDKYIVPLGIENHLERWNVDKNKIQNMAWWEEVTINELTIACTPAKHYSSRNLIDKDSTLWASFVLKNEYYQIFDSGDTGFGEHFEKIYEKYGDFDLSLLDSGQYDVRWANVHMNPEEAVKVGQILNSKIVMPIHNSTFKLANHPWDDPLKRFTTLASTSEVFAITPKIGETVDYKNYQKYTDKWWEDIK